MTKPTVWLQTGLVIIYGSSVDAASHNHHAIQLVWSNTDSVCQLNDIDSSGVLIIGSDEEHKLKLSEGWILLIEPQSDLGHVLTGMLLDKPYKKVSTLLSLTNSVKQGDDFTQLLAPLLRELKLKQSDLLSNHNAVKDKRIQQLLTELEGCLAGYCLKPTNWRAAEISHQLALSESRFLHLFSQEMGISWRPFLLWRRMICAIQALINNHSATEAAHLAGFADSAHLSRTFRRTCGMTIRQALSIFKTH